MKIFGTTAAGEEVHAFTISEGDLSATILTLGAILQSVRLAGVDHDLTLGSDRLADYDGGSMMYFGAVVGPVANRFSGATAPLGDELLSFEANQEGKHLLHSGAVGLHAKIWQVVEHRDNRLVMAVDLPAGEGNFPGARRVTAEFTISAPAGLRLVITATTDAETFFNITNHSYWNLDGGATWAGHRLWIEADRYMPTDDDAAPTGEVLDVAGSKMDFRTEHAPEPGDPPLDHNFCLSDGRTELRDVLTLTGRSGVSMTMATTEPGMQVYDDRGGGRPGAQPYEGLALEAQGWPDAPNHAAFPSIVVGAGEAYESVIEWRFSRG